MQQIVLVLNVTNVNNKNTKAKQDTPTQGIQAANLVMDAEHIENQSGGIYAGKISKILQLINLLITNKVRFYRLVELIL